MRPYAFHACMFCAGMSCSLLFFYDWKKVIGTFLAFMAVYFMAYSIKRGE